MVIQNECLGISYIFNVKKSIINNLSYTPQLGYQISVVWIFDDLSLIMQRPGIHRLNELVVYEISDYEWTFWFNFVSPFDFSICLKSLPLHIYNSPLSPLSAGQRILLIFSSGTYIPFLVL